MADAHATAAPTEFSLAIPLQFAAADGPTSEPRPRKLRGVAYGGEVITGHSYHQRLIWSSLSLVIACRIN